MKGTYVPLIGTHRLLYTTLTVKKFWRSQLFINIHIQLHMQTKKLRNSIWDSSKKSLLTCFLPVYTFKIFDPLRNDLINNLWRSLFFLRSWSVGRFYTLEKVQYINTIAVWIFSHECQYALCYITVITLFSLFWYKQISTPTDSH